MQVIDEAVAVIREKSSAFVARMMNDTLWRWRVIANSGVMQWGNGQRNYGGVGMIETEDGRVFLELNATSNGPVGIILNDLSGASISLTSVDGKLVIRDERYGRVLAEFE